MKHSGILAVLLSASIPSSAFSQSFSSSRAGASAKSSVPGAAGAISIVPFGFGTLSSPPPITIVPGWALTPEIKPSIPPTTTPRPLTAADKFTVHSAVPGGKTLDPSAVITLHAAAHPSSNDAAVFDGATGRASEVEGPTAGRESGTRATKPKPVFVTTSLKPITDWKSFRKQLDTLKRNGIAGVTSDLWWGKFEGAAQGNFDWSYYLEYAKTVRAAGLQWEPILSFHRCGGNVGDDCNEPLPNWLWKTSSNADQEMKFIDEKGFVNDEYVSFWHKGAYTYYEAAMASFASNFSSYADIIPRISVSLGPAGELRFPSYSFAAGWTYPQRGLLQAYSTPAREAFRAHIRQQYQDDLPRLNGVWGTQLKSFDEVQPPSDGDHFFKTATQIPYGHDFLNWYQGTLEGHLKRMMALAHKHLTPALSALLTAKIPGVHWLYNNPDVPHSAENTAGYVNYDPIVAGFKAANTALTFTALELDDDSSKDVNPGHTPPFSAPQTLARMVAALAKKHGVPIWGENALTIYHDGGYRNVGKMLPPKVLQASFLRLHNIVDDDGKSTPAMMPFLSYVVSPSRALRVSPRREGCDFGAAAGRDRARGRSVSGRALADAHQLAAAWLAADALTSGLFLLTPWLSAHYAAMAAASGWAANAVFFFFPWVQFLENLRNSRALRRGGAQADKADTRLSGVSSNSQTALIAGNMLNYPSFLASKNAALIGNSLMGAAGSLAILLQLALTRHFSRARLALMSAAVVAAALLLLALPMPALAVQALGIAATAIFSYFTVPQILKNRKSLAALRAQASEPQAAAYALESLKGITPRYLLIGLLGNLLLTPVFMVPGHWWNVLGNLIGIFGPLFILNQLSKAGLLSQKKLTLLAAASSVFVFAMMAAAYAASTAFWL